MKKDSSSNVKRPPAVVEPADRDIREYAYHLYQQSGCVPGRDLDNWLEAKACLQAGSKTHRPRPRVRLPVPGAGPLEQEELCAFSAEAHNISR